MKSLKKTEKIFSNSIDISTKAEYIVTIKSYLHPNKRFGKERKMKKVLSVLAVLAVAGGFAFAGEVAGAKEFVLKTTVAEEDPTFGLYYKLGAAGSEEDLTGGKEITVDLTTDGEFHAIAKCKTSNKGVNVPYTVTLTVDPDGKFMADNGLEGPEVKWDNTTASSEVAKGKLLAAQKLADFKATWKGDSNIGAGTYSYTASISVTTN